MEQRAILRRWAPSYVLDTNALKIPVSKQFAIDMLTIPASSCDYERLFSELGDLLEPRRRAIGSELLAALQLVGAWSKAGFNT